MNDFSPALETFLKQKQLRAAVLNGPWGVGKTYFAREFVRQHHDLLSAQSLRPAYVSLFGVQSVAEARNRICVSSLTVQADDADSFAWLKNARAWLARIPWPKSIQGVDTAGTAEMLRDSLQNHWLKDLFVCIDDLERRDGKVSISDVLGLISEPTEERNCKCLLVLNAEHLGSTLTDFRKMEEKVFDLFLHYDPMPADVIHLAIAEGDRAAALPVFTGLKCANIRVMQRLAWVLNELEACRCDRFDALRPQIVRQAAILVILHYVQSAVFTDLSKVTEWSRFSPQLWMMEDEGKKVDDVVQKQNDLLTSVEYDPLPYDPQVIQLLKTGLFDRTAFCENVAAAYSGHERQIKRDEFGKIWDRYKNNFSTNAATFVELLSEFLRESRQHLERREIALACDYLLRLDPNRAMRGLAVESLAPIAEGVPFKDRHDVFREYRAILASNILDAVPFVKTEKTPSLEELFTSVTNDSSWHGEAYRTIAAYNDAEIEQFLVKYAGDHLFTRLNHFFERLSSAPPHVADILTPRFKVILDKLAASDPLNRERIEGLVPKRPK